MGRGLTRLIPGMRFSSVAEAEGDAGLRAADLRSQNPLSMDTRRTLLARRRIVLPRSGRSWSCRSRAQAPVAECRRRAAFPYRAHSGEELRPQAPATLQLHLPSGLESNDPTRHLRVQRSATDDITVGGHKTSR